MGTASTKKGTKTTNLRISTNNGTQASKNSDNQMTVTPMTDQPNASTLEMSIKLNNAELANVEETVNDSVEKNKEIDQLKAENERLKEMLQKLQNENKNETETV